MPGGAGPLLLQTVGRRALEAFRDFEAQEGDMEALLIFSLPLCRRSGCPAVPGIKLQKEDNNRIHLEPPDRLPFSRPRSVSRCRLQISRFDL